MLPYLNNKQGKRIERIHHSNYSFFPGFGTELQLWGETISVCICFTVEHPCSVMVIH